MAPGMPIPSWTRSRNGSSSVALSRNVGPAGDGRSVGNNRPRSWMACGSRWAVAGPTVQRIESRSFPIASASSVSRAVVVVRHAKRCSDTGIPPADRGSQVSALGVGLPSGTPFRCKHRIKHRKRAPGQRGLRAGATCKAATTTETRSLGSTEDALDMRISCFVMVSNVRWGNAIAY